MADEKMPVPAQEEEDEAIQFPIYVMKKGVKLPESGMYFVIGSNGVFAHKQSRIGRSLVPVESISFLEPVSAFIIPSLPKLPKRVVAQAVSFFRQVFNRYHSEAGVVIYYNPDKRDFILWCPKQEVSGGSCDYDRNDSGQNEPSLVGYNIVGTIHSHCDFQAFHSGVDIHDEELYDGLHITIGNVNRAAVSMCSSFVQHRTREQVEPEYCCLGINKEVDTSTGSIISFHRTNYYNVDPISKEEKETFLQDAENIREHWLPKVEKKTWGNWFGKKKDEDDSGDSLGGHYGIFGI